MKERRFNPKMLNHKVIKNAIYFKNCHLRSVFNSLQSAFSQVVGLPGCIYFFYFNFFSVVIFSFKELVLSSVSCSTGASKNALHKKTTHVHDCFLTVLYFRSPGAFINDFFFSLLGF